MKIIHWFLWAIRGIRPLSDERFREWVRQCPNDDGGLASPEPSPSPSGGDVRDHAEIELRADHSRKVEDGTGRVLTAEQWRQYNHRYVREFVYKDGAASFERCGKCEMGQVYPIHWIADALAEHVASGGLPAEFRIPEHPFWKNNPADACGVCGRPEDHVNHAGVPIDWTAHVERGVCDEAATSGEANPK